MAEDFRIQVETDLDTSKAEQKLNALLKEKRQIKLDIDINNQNIKIYVEDKRLFIKYKDNVF